MQFEPHAPTPNPPTPDYIRALVSHAGISLNEAARRAGVTRQTFSRWCLGVDHPNYKQAPWGGIELLRSMLVK